MHFYEGEVYEVGILDELGKPYGDLLFCLGYSAGGHGAMAIQKYVDTHCRGEIKINKTYAGGGAYDLRSLFEEGFKINLFNYICAIPLLTIGFNENSRLDIPYENLFKSPLLENYDEWIVSKKYGESQISEFMGTNLLSDVFADNLFDENDASRQKLMIEFDKNTLTSGWTPDRDANILIVHALQDTYVPVVSALDMHQYLKDQGVTNVEGVFLEEGDHEDAMPLMIARAIFEMATWR